MLRELVFSRLAPKAYRETEEGPGYVLHVAERGVKFKETPSAEEGIFVAGAASEEMLLSEWRDPKTEARHFL